jgi:hypothetical protein
MDCPVSSLTKIPAFGQSVGIVVVIIESEVRA